LSSNLLITNKSNIRYLSNFTGSNGFMLITKSKKYLFTDFRYIERAKDTIYKRIEIIDTTKMWKNPKQLKENWQNILKRHRIHTLGVEEASLTVTQLKSFKKISRIPNYKISYKDVSGTVEKKREIKTKQEISYIQKSQRINEKVFFAIKKFIQNTPKATEQDIAFRIRELGYKFGAEDLSFDPIVAFGKHSAIPHHLPTNKRRNKNDIVLIDMGMKYKGYCSDMTRTFFTGKPTTFQTEIYNLVLKAQTEAIKKIKPGITGQAADNCSRIIINKAGFEEEYGHAGGHGIGLDIHERPSLSDKYTKALRLNSVITVEPGIYLPGKFGVRIEDMLLLTKNGSKNLTKAPKTL